MKQLKFPLKKFKFEIYNRPGVWMDNDELDRLQERLSSIAESKLKMRPSFSFFKDQRYLKNKLVVIASLRNGGDLACCIMSYLGLYKKRKVVHLGAVYSSTENRGVMKIIYTLGLLFLFIKNGLFRRMYLTSLTHTPKIFGTVSESFDAIYPNLNTDDRPSELHIALKNIFMKTYLAEWDLPEKPAISDNFIIESFRKQQDGSILYPDTRETVPKHRNSAYNERCFQMIDYERGDEVLQTGLTFGIVSFLKRNFKTFSLMTQ